jgi:hypothetical protein
MNTKCKNPTLGYGLGMISPKKNENPSSSGRTALRLSFTADREFLPWRDAKEYPLKIVRGHPLFSARQTVKTARQKPKNSGRAKLPKIFNSIFSKNPKSGFGAV